MFATFTYTVVTMLYTISPELVYLITGSFYLFDHLHPFPPSNPPPTPICSLYLWINFFLDSTYNRNHTVFVFVWLISLSIMPLRSIHVVTMAGSPFLLLNNIPLYICIYISISYLYLYILHFLYPFIHWWTLNI